jgi:electron transport complex protein RnfC
VACGELPTARVVTVAGPKVNKPVNLLVPFGAGVEEILESAEAGAESRFVYGSAMTGRHLVAGAVVSAATNALLAMEPKQRQSPTPCIRCGWCSDNCPARINVAALNDDFELGRTAAAKRKNAQACIECGICSYVCPARLPLMQRVRLLKQAIRKEMS